MMHYIDIHLRSDPETPEHQLMAALYAKLHRALVQVQASTIGVSFPGYLVMPTTLGRTLRLLGPQAELSRLMELGWLKGMRDHADVGAIEPVPAHAVHRDLRRVQAKSSPERLRRRQMRRHDLTAHEARERVPDSAMERLRLPFVQVASQSTGQVFRLYLRLGPPGDIDGTNGFNAYGLSATATIPWF